MGRDNSEKELRDLIKKREKDGLSKALATIIIMLLLTIAALVWLFFRGGEGTL